MGQSSMGQRKVSGYAEKRFEKLFGKRKNAVQKGESSTIWAEHRHIKKERSKFSFSEFKFYNQKI